LFLILAFLFLFGIFAASCSPVENPVSLDGEGRPMDNMVGVTTVRVIVENASSQGAYVRFVDEGGGDISNL
jgi:hypothetical protein